MSKAVSILRKIGILLLAVPLFIVGIILIPLPGPGLLICLAALFLLSLEFDWAKPHMERVRTQLNRVVEAATRKQRQQADKTNKKKKQPKKLN